MSGSNLITRVTLCNFRNHKILNLSTDKKTVFLVGDNGVGKTSILEAISLFSPGKNLSSANVAQQQYRDLMQQGSKPSPYQVEVELNNAIVLQAISKMINNNPDKASKVLKVNNKTVTKQTSLLSWCDILWFTAKMQYDLLTPSYRRKFFDRLAFHLNEKQAQLLNSYDKLIRDRLQALQQPNHDQTWLTAVENQIAICGLEIAKNRVSAAQKINEVSLGNNKFLPKVQIVFNGQIEHKIIEGLTDTEVVEFFKKGLMDYRQRDRLVGQTSFGIHKTIVDLVNEEGVSFVFLSSGQQKMLFLSLVYVIGNVIGSFRQRHPIILFDEMISFLDSSNIKKVLDTIANSFSQIWITTQNKGYIIDQEDWAVIQL